MKSSRPKRQRLTYVSSRQKADLPAIFESLNDDTLTTVLEFVGKKSYRSFGGTNKRCKEVYLNTEGMTKETFLYGYGPLSVIQVRIERATFLDQWELFNRVGKGVVLYDRKDVLALVIQRRYISLLLQICYEAAEEGRIDVLEEVWGNIDDDRKKYVFERVPGCAGRCGKVNTLKWFETKGFVIDKDMCANEAAEYGHLHIIQWLQEEKGLQLDGGLYGSAAKGGQMRVIKWFRELELDWYEETFLDAAEGGNLDILQWLHDEGCPWPEGYLILEDALKPEVIDWCRTNGYSSRIR